MKIKFLIVILTFTISSFGSYSQMPGFRYYRNINEVKESGWYLIELSYRNFGNLKNDFSSLRLYEEYEGKTEEIPFVLDKTDFFEYYTQEKSTEEIPVKQLSVKENERLKKTIVEVELDNEMNVWAIRIYVKPDREYYYRYVQIYRMCNGEEDDNSWSNAAMNVSWNYLGSNDPDKCYFMVDPNLNTNCLSIEIENGDDKPLRIDSVKIYSPRHQMRARFYEGRKYFMAYGNEDIMAPEYDIVNFRNEIPEVLDTINIGEEKEFSKNDRPGNNKEKQLHPENEGLWIWIVLIVVIAILGFFAYKMIKSDKLDF